MILTQEYSRVANLYDLDNRAWLVSPQGEIYACGEYHTDCLMNEELRDRVSLPEGYDWEDQDLPMVWEAKLLNDGWMRVGVLNSRLAIETKNRLTATTLSLLQKFAKNISDRYQRVEIHTADNVSFYFDQRDFLIATLKDINRRGVAHYSSREASYNPDDRAWLISPQGKIIPCGNDHEEYIYRHPEEFDGEFTGLLSSYALVNSGWTRVGVIGGIFFVHIKDMLTAKNLGLLQKLAKETSIPYKQVQIHKDSGSSLYFKPEEFQVATLKDINRRGVAHYAKRKQASSTTRAWMISPQGEVHDCGSGEHEDYVVDHMKEFGGHDMYSLREEGWIQVGVFENNNFYFESLDLLSLTNLNIIQKLARQTQIPYSKVEVHVGETGMKVFTKEEFQLATLKDVNRRGVNYYASRRATYAPDDRAWMISPEGKIYNCEYLHETCLVTNRDLGKITEEHSEIIPDLVEKGWGKVGYFVFGKHKISYLEQRGSLTDRVLGSFHEILSDINSQDDDIINFRTDRIRGKVFWGEFKNRKSLMDLENYLRSKGTQKQAALPHSRNLLKDISLEELTYPLRKAFMLLNLENDYKDMSLNQIASKLRTHETLLEDETGWTSDELIRDLNQILE